MMKAPYYCIYNVGDYTFSKYKVIWAEQSGNFSAAIASSKFMPIIGERIYVPDHKIFFTEFENYDEALFLCGLLNCNIVREFVDSHNISIQVGDIFKHMSLPMFDIENEKHRALTILVRDAHNEDNMINRKLILNEISKLSENIL